MHHPSSHTLWYTGWGKIKCPNVSGPLCSVVFVSLLELVQHGSPHVTPVVKGVQGGLSANHETLTMKSLQCCNLPFSRYSRWNGQNLDPKFSTAPKRGDFLSGTDMHHRAKLLWRLHRKPCVRCVACVAYDNLETARRPMKTDLRWYATQRMLLMWHI